MGTRVPGPNRASAKVLKALRGRRPLWRFLESFCRKVEAGGGRSYLAGGLVRDLIEGKPGKDIDLMVAGVDFGELGRMLRSLPRKTLGLGRIHPVGRAFPVYKIRASWTPEEIDVALARTERSTGPGHRDFRIRTRDVDAREDASRRDFTINSILFAFRVGKGGLTGSVVDFFDGIGDLKRRLIRGVGNPEARFREDPLRILRAVRQKNERPGGAIEEKTLKAMVRAAPRLIESVSGERIAAELLRSLSANPSGTVEDLSRTGILRRLLPVPRGTFRDLPGRTMRRYRRLEKSLGHPLPPVLLFANLLADAAAVECRERLREHAGGSRRARSPILSSADDRRIFRLPRTESVARRLVLPQVRTVVRLLEDRNRVAHIGLLSNPRARVEAIFRRWKTPEILLAFEEAIRKTDGGGKAEYPTWLEEAGKLPPLLTGRDLLDAGMPAGPGVEAILEKVREATLARKIRRREDAMTLAFSLRRGSAGARVRIPAKRFPS